MVWRNGVYVHLMASGLIGLACAAGCGGESSRRDGDGGEAGDEYSGPIAARPGIGGSNMGGKASTGGSGSTGATGGTGASGGASATGGTATGGTATGGTSASAGSAGTVPSLFLPELYFYRFFAEAATGPNGEDGTYVEFAIANRGDASAQPPHRFTLVLSKDPQLGNGDDITLYELIVDEVIPAPDQLLTPGVEREGFVVIDATIPEGMYYVGGIIDADQQVTESNEDNNTQFSNRIFVGTEDYNVEVTEFTAPTGVALPGSVISVSMTARLSGNRAIDSADFDFVLSEDAVIDADDLPFCFGTIGPLEIGEFITVASDCTLPRLTGDYYLGVRLDPDDVLEESNEDDNTRLLDDPLELRSPDIDLTIAGFSGVDLELDWLGDLDLTVQIENSGSEAAGPLQVTMYLSQDAELDAADLQICQRAVAAVGAGAAADVLIQCHLPSAAAGEMRLIAVVDSLDSILETDEDNNVGTAEETITIGSPDFDLVYGIHNVTAMPLYQGAMFGLTIQVQNAGADAIPGFDADVYFSTDSTLTTDDTLACSSAFVDPIPGSTIANVTLGCQVPLALPVGDYYLGVTLDPNAALPETNENNNQGVDSTPRFIGTE